MNDNARENKQKDTTKKFKRPLTNLIKKYQIKRVR